MNKNCFLLLLLILIIWFLYRSKATFINKYKPLYLFWHIGALKGRSERLTQILNRQWNLINSSGLYDQLDKIYIGIIGPERPPILVQLMNNPKVYVIEPNQTMPSKYECYTTQFLWQFCKENPNCNVIYIHSRGVTRNSGIPPHVDDWTKMMEHFNIKKWKDNIQLIDKYQTLGCELWDVGKQRPGEAWSGKFYSGNFWWARASYINRLTSPFEYSKRGTNRWDCGEFWILKDKNFNISEHKVLFHTEPTFTLAQPKHDLYKDPLPRSIYI